MLWSVLYFIFVFLWQIPAKKKYNIVGGNVSHSSGIETGRDFPPVFLCDWDGMGSFFLREWDGRDLKIHSRVTLYFTPEHVSGVERWESPLIAHGTVHPSAPPLKATSGRSAHYRSALNAVCFALHSNRPPRAPKKKKNLYMTFSLDHSLTS